MVWTALSLLTAVEPVNPEDLTASGSSGLSSVSTCEQDVINMQAVVPGVCPATVGCRVFGF